LSIGNNLIGDCGCENYYSVPLTITNNGKAYTIYACTDSTAIPVTSAYFNNPSGFTNPNPPLCIINKDDSYELSYNQ